MKRPLTEKARGAALRAAKRGIEAALRRHVKLHHAHGPKEYRRQLDSKLRNILGVAIGQSHATDGSTHAESTAPGEPVLLLLVERPMSHAAARRLLVQVIGATSAAAKSVPIEVIVTGAIRAHAQTFKLRPAAPGSSVGNCGMPSGTFGFLARGRTAPRSGQLFVISNCHVLATDTLPPPGKGISQPGRTDGGTCPTEQIGVLEQFVPIQFGKSNRVDAAAALASPALVRSELLFIQGGTPSFVPIGHVPEAATIGMTVGKSGRSTGLTMGRVMSTSSSVIATYGTRTALFVDQILVTGANGPFSDAGDSGSLVWTWTPQRNPVGLLFGGAGGVSFVNHIADVLDALDVDLA